MNTPQDTNPPNEDTTPLEPPPWTWAATARLMAGFGDDDGFDWDVWKDEMKEGRAW